MANKIALRNVFIEQSVTTPITFCKLSEVVISVFTFQGLKGQQFAGFPLSRWDKFEIGGGFQTLACLANIQGRYATTEGASGLAAGSRLTTCDTAGCQPALRALGTRGRPDLAGGRRRDGG